MRLLTFRGTNGNYFLERAYTKTNLFKISKKKKKFYFDSIYVIETTELGWLWTSMRNCHIYSYIFFGAVRSYMLYAFETWN